MTSADPPTQRRTSGGAGAIRPGRALDIPLYPGTTAPPACPRGHELLPGRFQLGYTQDYARPEVLCEVCHALPSRAGRWALIDPAITAQVPESEVETAKLLLVVLPPSERAGVGTIQLRWGTTVYGQIQLSLCLVDRAALLVGVHVEQQHRRRGVGTVLVAAARARGHSYRWSANPPATRDPITDAFWARLGAPPSPARPCSHQQAAGINLQPRWPRWY